MLSGEVHASTAGVLVDESLYMRSAVLGRLRQARMAATPAWRRSRSAGRRRHSPTAARRRARLRQIADRHQGAAASRRAERDIVFWAQGFGARGRFDTDGNAASVQRDLAGFITGVDARVGDGRVGIAAGYTGSKNNLDGRGTANVETGHIAAYGGWRFGALNLRAGGAYAFHTIDTDGIAFPGFFDRATAHYDGRTGQISARPATVRVRQTRGRAVRRRRMGAGQDRRDGRARRAAALNVAGTTFETGYSTLGMRAASMIPLAHDMVLIPRARSPGSMHSTA